MLHQLFDVCWSLVFGLLAKWILQSLETISTYISVTLIIDSLRVAIIYDKTTIFEYDILWFGQVKDAQFL